MKIKSNPPEIEVPLPQFGVRFFCSDGTSYRDDLSFPEYEVAACFAEVEMELVNGWLAEGHISTKLIRRFEIFPVVIVLIH